MSTDAFGFEAYVSAEKIAQFLGLEKREVLRLTRSGRIPGIPVDPTVSRRTWRYKVSQVDAAMAARALSGKKPYNHSGNPTDRKAS